jgi:hypothetical protein
MTGIYGARPFGARETTQGSNGRKAAIATEYYSEKYRLHDTAFRYYA